jgi:hypothetical protein
MRKRILLIPACLLVLAAALAVPLRREYSIINTASNQADQLTAVHYGTPVTWLVLSKQVDVRNPNDIKKRTRQYDYKALALDVLVWGAIISFIAWLARATEIPPIRTRRGRGRS